MIPPALDPNNECSAPSGFMCRRTYQNRDRTQLSPRLARRIRELRAAVWATVPTVCQPQKVHMLAFKPGLPMFLRTEWGHRVVLFTSSGVVAASGAFVAPAASCLRSRRPACVPAHLCGRAGQDQGPGGPSNPRGLGAENSIRRTFRPASRTDWMCAAA
jgi:hypothetical protein